MLLHFFHELRKNQRGATAIEYGLIAVLISIAVLGALTTMGDSVLTLYNSIQANVAAANSQTTP